MKDAERLAALVRTGFESVGCMVPVTVDDDVVIVRDLVVEFEKNIACMSVGGDGRAITVFNLPLEAEEAAAAAVVMKVISGIVSRAIESAGP